MVLKKTVDSPLDSKEIKPVNPKGLGFPGGSAGKKSTWNAGDLGYPLMHINEVSFMYSWEGPLEEEMATHSSIFA